MKKICVITGTRAEYGILSSLMQRLQDDPEIQLQIIATNMHLSPEFGMTVNEIETDGFHVDKKIEMLLSSDTPVGTVKSMGLAQIGFADAFEELAPDMIVILGDRYEMLAAASAALIFGIPVAHLHGGEVTEGAFDDSVRHAITKLSWLHFASTEEYRRRIIQMGEQPIRVLNVGSIAADEISRFRPMSVDQLEDSLGVKLAEDYIVVTFHPVTNQPGEAERQVGELLGALSEQVLKDSEFNSVKVLFTMPNSDAEGRAVARMIRDWCDANVGRTLAVTSLGRDRYYSAVAHSAGCVGNSSSGLIEAPSLNVPTLNIGDRQKGRAHGNTVVDCAPEKHEIKAGLMKILSPTFRKFVELQGNNPYYKPDTTDTIYRALKLAPLRRNAMKHFHDISF